MNVEVQCWGYTLTQAANLHVMLAFKNCTYFEQPVPYPAFEYGSHNVIRTDKDGYVHAPDGTWSRHRGRLESDRKGVAPQIRSEALERFLAK